MAAAVGAVWVLGPLAAKLKDATEGCLVVGMALEESGAFVLLDVLHVQQPLAGDGHEALAGGGRGCCKQARSARKQHARTSRHSPPCACALFAPCCRADAADTLPFPLSVVATFAATADAARQLALAVAAAPQPACSPTVALHRHGSASGLAAATVSGGHCVPLEVLDAGFAEWLRTECILCRCARLVRLHACGHCMLHAHGLWLVPPSLMRLACCACSSGATMPCVPNRATPPRMCMHRMPGHACMQVPREVKHQCHAHCAAGWGLGSTSNSSSNSRRRGAAPRLDSCGPTCGCAAGLAARRPARHHQHGPVRVLQCASRGCAVAVGGEVEGLGAKGWAFMHLYGPCAGACRCC